METNQIQPMLVATTNPDDLLGKIIGIHEKNRNLEMLLRSANDLIDYISGFSDSHVFGDQLRLTATFALKQAGVIDEDRLNCFEDFWHFSEDRQTYELFVDTYEEAGCCLVESISDIIREAGMPESQRELFKSAVVGHINNLVDYLDRKAKRSIEKDALMLSILICMRSRLEAIVIRH